MAHMLQFNVKEAFSKGQLKALIANIRKSFKSCCKREVGGYHLLADLLANLRAARHKFKRLLHDVPTRWVSTLAMLQRFWCARSAVASAVMRLYQDKVKYRHVFPGFTPTELNDIHVCV